MLTVLARQPAGRARAGAGGRPGGRRRRARAPATRRSPSARAPPWCSRSAPSTGRWRSARSAWWRRSGRWGSWCRSSAGLAQGEEPAAIQAVGVVAGVVGVVLVAREPDPEWRAAGRAAVGLAALAALGFGTFFLALDAPPARSRPGRSSRLRCGGVGDAADRGRARPALDADRARRCSPPCSRSAASTCSPTRCSRVATNHGLLSLVAVAGSLYSGGHRAARPVRPRRAAGAASSAPGSSLALIGVALIAAGS